MRIGVIGGGVVGGATARAFADFAESVHVYDTNPTRRTAPLLDVLDFADVIFVALPTPQQKDGMACDTSFLDRFFADLRDCDRKCLFVLRSTVPVGYTRRAAKHYQLTNVVHAPEFLTARTADHDAAHPVRNLVGAVPGCARAAMTLCDLYAQRFPDVPLFTMNSDESELVKLMQNAFSAVKLSFFNECHRFAAGRGLRWDTLLTALLAGGWINPMHTTVPGADGFGWGGACLPKDTANLISCLEQAGLEPRVMAAAYERNLDDRRRKA